MTKRHALGPAALLALLAAVPGAGCRQIAGIDDDPEPPALLAAEGGASCGVAFASADCDACMASSCCAEATRCAADASCGALETCVGACAAGDVACASACRSGSEAGYGAASAALHRCESTKCASACQVTCGGYVYADPECGKCGIANCCALSATCAGDVECSVLGVCERACAPGDANCLLRCELDHPNGVAAERALGSCLSTSCGKACTQQWACLQHPAKPLPALVSHITITYRFVDYESYAPLVGFSVRLCNTMDLLCTTPIAEGEATTDVGGRATLHPFANSFNGYAEIRGAGYPTVLLYVPDLTKDFDAPPLPIPTQTRFTAIFAEIATPRDDLGSLVMTVRDCLGGAAAGVQFAIEPADESKPFYFTRRFPSKVATETDDDGYGGGGFASVTPNTQITIQAKVKESQLPFPKRYAVARPGGTNVTYVLIEASPP